MSEPMLVHDGITGAAYIGTKADLERENDRYRSQVVVGDRQDRQVRLPDVDAIIELINEGLYDDCLEDILAAAHGRKRERRGCRRPYGRL